MQTLRAKHLVFYDGSCGLCDHAVQFVLKHDQQGLFVFAPLQGLTAERLLKTKPEADSLILIENYQAGDAQTYILGKGAFRILWQLGGIWAIPGAISFLPAFLYDWGYRLIAKNRHRIFPETCTLPKSEYKDRFFN